KKGICFSFIDYLVRGTSLINDAIHMVGGTSNSRVFSASPMMARFAPDPFMVYLLKLVGYDHDTDPTNVVFLALHRGGYLHPPDLFNLNELETARMTYLDTTVQPPIIVPLNRGFQVRILALKHFRDEFETRENRHMNETDWAMVTVDDMNDHIMRGNILSNPTPIVAPTSTTSTTLTRNTGNAIEAFRKTIRRDPSHFATFTDRAKWAEWQLSFEATARAQDLADVINPSYVPSTAEERTVFDAKQQYVFSVFVKVLRTDEGKTLVRKHVTGFNAQEIYRDLVEYYNKSIHSEINAGKILSFLSSFRLGHGNWAGPDTNTFLNYFMEQMRRYDEISRSAGAPPMHDVHKIQMLDSAVQEVEELRQVRVGYQTMCLHTGSSSKFQDYFDLMHSASMVYDNKKKSSRTSSRGPPSRDRKAYYTQAHYEAESYLDTYDDYAEYYQGINGDDDEDPQHIDVNIDTPLSTINIFAAQQERRSFAKPAGGSRPSYSDPSIRLPDVAFNKLSRDDRSNWFKFSPEGRRVILSAPRPTSQPGNSSGIARTNPGISSVDRRVLLADTQHSLTHDDLAPDPADFQQQYATQSSSTTTPTASASFPGDLRRVMSSSAARPSNKSVSINKTLTYTLNKVNLQGAPFGALVDRGANGGIAGADCRILASNPDSFVNIEGIDHHQLTNIPVVSCGAYAVSKNHGPVILIFHQLAGVQKGPSILSAAQLESYYNKVNERSLLFDRNGQLIVTNDGFELPLNMRNGLAYLDMRPFTDLEWDTYPHVVMTSDVNWDPSTLDGEFPLSGDEHLGTTDAYDNESPFDPFGNYLHGTIVSSSHVLRDHPVLVEATFPTDVVDEVASTF
ncbi:MAG: hypothetical protein ACKOB3_03670, partial [Holophagaceae bacterium]